VFADARGRRECQPRKGNPRRCVVLLLAEVDFKWLMAGRGQWIDLARFRCDSLYAAGLIRLALTSNSLALRECAALLQIPQE